MMRRAAMDRRTKERRLLMFLAAALSVGHAYVVVSVLRATEADIFIFAIIVLFRFVYFSVVSIYRNAASLLVWLYIELSMILWPAVNAMVGYRFYADEYVAFSYRLGLMCLFIHAMIALLPWWSFTRKISAPLSPWQGLSKGFIQSAWFSFIVVSFSATILVDQLGLDTLGLKGAGLPFKLAGLVNYYRYYAVPFLFIVFLDIFYAKYGKRKVLNGILIYLAWNILEMAVRLSKGQIMLAIIPLLLWAAYRGVFKVSWVKYFAFLFVLLFAVYTTTGEYRARLHAGSNISFLEVARMQYDLVRSDKTALTIMGVGIYERMFATGSDIAKFLPFMDAPYWSGKLDEVSAYGGSQKYHTRVVVGVPEAVPYSAGATGISDAFLIGGIPLTALTMALLSVLSVVVVDRGRLRFITRTPAGRAMAAYFIFMLMMGGTWSWVFKGLLPNLVWPSLFIFHGWLSGRALRVLSRRRSGTHGAIA